MEPTMQPDIRTLVLIIGMVHALLLLAIWVQYRTSRGFDGPGWWLLWCAAETLGFGFYLFRGNEAWLTLVILGQNGFMVLGTFFLYIGIARFLDRPVRLTRVFALYAVFFAGVFFFRVVVDEITVRGVLVWITLCCTATVSATTLLRHRTPAVNVSAVFAGTIFALHAMVTLAQLLVILVRGRGDVGWFDSSWVNYGVFFDALVVSLLWTFSFIIMINQRLTAELREARDRFLLIFQTSPDAILVTRLEDGRIEDVNDGFVRIFGARRSDVIGRTTEEIAMWSEPGARREFVSLLSSSGHVHNLEARLQDRTGRPVASLISATVVRLQREQHIVSLVHDISDRIEREEVIRRRNDELSRVVADKDRLFSIIAHDLRGPFNALLGFTGMLHDEFDTMGSTEMRRIIGHVNRSAHVLYTLVDNLLEWSRIQRGTIEFAPQELPLASVIREAAAFPGEMAERKNVALTIAVPLDLIVKADLHMVATVARNLLSNAVKFTPQGGRIDIDAVAVGGGWVDVRVRDTGVGIPAELLPSLFDADARSGRRGTEGEQSVGLGLIICRDFVERHGGAMHVTSDPEQGSIFSFTIPSAP